MRKFISILMIVLAFTILCTSCEPTTSKKDSGGDPTPPPTPSPIYPKTLDTYEKYTKALDDVLNADKTGKLIYIYATKNTPCGAELREYATPEFFATVDEAVKFDEYTVKMKMKGEPLKYVYIYNSKHYESAIEDADLMYRELNK